MVRFGKKEDIEIVNKIRKEVNDLHIKGEPKTFKTGFPKEMADYLFEFVDSENKKFLVYEEDNKIYGYAMIEFVIRPETIYRYELKYLDIQELGVFNEIQGKGIGKQIMKKIEEIAIQNGYPRIELNMWSFNELALKFYENMGFENYRKYLRKFL